MLYDVSNETIPREELEEFFHGHGYQPYFVEGDDPPAMHQLMAGTLDNVMNQIKQIQGDARSGGFKHRPRWPMST